MKLGGAGSKRVFREVGIGLTAGLNKDAELSIGGVAVRYVEI